MHKYIHSVIACILLLLLGLTLFPSAGRDDAYMTYWSALSLSERGEILNYNGERVEQSSSLLNVLILALMHKISGSNIVLLGVTLSILAALGTVFMTQRLAHAVFREGALACAVPYILATGAFFMYWSFGGMETTLTALCTVSLVYYCVRYFRDNGSVAGLVLSLLLYLLVRPESFFIALCAVAVATLLFISRKGISQKGSREPSGRFFKKAAFLTFCALIIFSVIVAFRYIYFGALFPQPVVAKSSGIEPAKFGEGLLYIAKQLRYPNMTLMLLMLVSYFASSTRKADLPKIILAVFILSQVLFAIACGGDWMEGGRFLVPVFPLICVSVAGVAQEFKNKKWHIVFWLLFANIVSLFAFAVNDSTGMPIWKYRQIPRFENFEEYSFFEKCNKAHLRDIPVANKLNKVLDAALEYYDRPITILSAQAGMVIFHAAKSHYGKIHFIDLKSITTRHFTDSPVTKNKPRTEYGLKMRYEDFFRNFRALKESSANISRPDIVFELRRGYSTIFPLLKSNNYEMVYMQSGNLKGSETFPGVDLQCGQYISVRSDFLDKIRDKVKRERRRWKLLYPISIISTE